MKINILQKVFLLVLCAIICALISTNSVFAFPFIAYMSAIKGNASFASSDINLILGGIHETEQLTVECTDSSNNTITSPTLTWESSNTTVATVDSTGKVTAKKVGTSDITVTSGDFTRTKTITVIADPSTSYADFSSATFEILQSGTIGQLHISNVEEDHILTYILSDSATTPTVTEDSYGGIDSTNSKYLNTNSDMNTYYSTITETAELNQDIYLWVLEEISFGAGIVYYDESGQMISKDWKYLVEAEKIDPLETSKMLAKGLFSSNYSNLGINAISSSSNKSFTLNIGKLTDYDILSKFQNGDSSAADDLLTYAQNNDTVFSTTLKTTSNSLYYSEGHYSMVARF